MENARQQHFLYESINKREGNDSEAAKMIPLDSSTANSPSRIPPSHSTAAASRNSSESTAAIAKHPSSRSLWGTPEFILYYIVIFSCFFAIFKAAYNFSNELHPNYRYYAFRLGEGWLFGRSVDISDHQFRGFREFMNLLTMGMCGFAIVNRLAKYALYHLGILRQTEHLYRAGLSLLILFALHGFASIKIIAIIGANYLIAKWFGPSRLNPILTWAFCIVTIFVLEWFSLPFGSISPYLKFMEFSGMYPRWTNVFKISFLRMISYNMDYYYSFHEESAVSEDEKRHFFSQALYIVAGIVLIMRFDEYCWINYISYMLYFPLYVAGPIITFNNFTSQLKCRATSLTLRNILTYGVRLVGSILTLEVILHCCYVVAVKDTKAWYGFSPLDFGAVAFINLKIIWLKLLIIWRFFRFWAMVDGIDATENMMRCMSNNYSTQGFWRSWHRSFNQWIIRYMYVPLGGGRTAIYNIWPIFTFVAVWHDVELKLLTWGWLICLFIVPEVLVVKMSNRLQLEKLPYYRHLCALGAVGNIFLMMIANLVGFAVGVDGATILLSKLASFEGVAFLCGSAVAFFASAQVMLEIRQSERRRGIFVNY